MKYDVVVRTNKAKMKDGTWSVFPGLYSMTVEAQNPEEARANALSRLATESEPTIYAVQPK